MMDAMDADCKELVERLPELPESAQTVFCRLYQHKPMTGKQIREATGLPRRTLYTALQRLKETGVLKEQVSLRDSRQSFYWLNEEEVDHLADHPLHVHGDAQGVAAGA